MLDIGNKIMESMKNNSAEEQERISSLSIRSSNSSSLEIEHVTQIVNYPIQMIAPAAIEAETPFLLQMRNTVLLAPDGHAFITSDAPVVWYDPEGHKRLPMYQSPALINETLEITIPLSPREMLMIVHSKPMAGGIKPIEYVHVTKDVVSALNRRTLFFADREVVVNRNLFEEQWIRTRPRETRN